MEQFAILEGNMDRLLNKLVSIENKCKKFGCSFHFKRVGEEFREVKHVDEFGRVIAKETCKFIIVEAEGVAKVNDWRFIATIDHTPNGNVIRKFDYDAVIPEKYFTGDSFCEHCNTKRRRGQTCLVYNDVTCEWKQVGKSCLQLFTNGLSAEDVARYISWYDEIIRGEEPYTGCHIDRYYDVKQTLLYAKECVNKFGYFNSQSPRSTADRSWDYICAHEGWIKWIGEEGRKRLLAEMNEVNFNAESDENVTFVEGALEWIRNKDVEGNDYLHNLQVIAAVDQFKMKDHNMLVSLVTAYQRELDHIAKVEREKKTAEENPSEYQGQVGQRITFVPSSIKCVYSSDSQFGTSWLYSIEDVNHNIYTWFTSKFIDCSEESETVITSITGTVKGHSEFRGVKQTEMTRCKLTEEKKPEHIHEEYSGPSLDEVFDCMEEKEYSPSCPWNAPGMRVSDFVR